MVIKLVEKSSFLFKDYYYNHFISALEVDMFLFGFKKSKHIVKIIIVIALLYEFQSSLFRKLQVLSIKRIKKIISGF